MRSWSFDAHQPDRSKVKPDGFFSSRLPPSQLACSDVPANTLLILLFCSMDEERCQASALYRDRTFKNHGRQTLACRDGRGRGPVAARQRQQRWQQQWHQQRQWQWQWCDRRRQRWQGADCRGRNTSLLFFCALFFYSTVATGLSSRSRSRRPSARSGPAKASVAPLGGR